jgi:hypothetical protein
MPVPVGRLGRIPQWKRFRGEAAFRYEGQRFPFYGLGLHVRLAPSGLVTRLVLAPADVSEMQVAEWLTEGTQGEVLADRYDASRTLPDRLDPGLVLLAPYRWRRRDPTPALTHALNQVRQIVEVVFGQLTGRFRRKQVWARDLVECFTSRST